MMKRLILLLLVTLLLCGCDTETPPVQTTAPVQETTVQTAPTEPAGFYVPGSDLETATGGSVRVYVPEDTSCYALEIMDGDILLFSGEGTTTLTRLTGENLYPIAQIQLDCMVYPEAPFFQAGSKGITYYDEGTDALVFLDNDLKEVNRVSVPENMMGTPVLSANRLKLYYCTADAVRVLDLETGLDKLLKQIPYSYQSVEGILFNDTVLQCYISDDSGGYTLFLSTETGELLDMPQEGVQVTGKGESFFAVLSGGTMQELLFGTGRDDVQVLTPANPFGTIWCQEQTNAVVMSGSTDTALSLEYYDLETGQRTAVLELNGEYVPWYVEECADGSAVYLMGYDSGLERPAIYRWDLSLTAVQEETVYTGPWYTLDNPDHTGLDLCAKAAAELGNIYGLDILIGPDAAAVEPWDYEMEAEYQVPVIQRELEKLENCLEAFPEDFFRTIDEDIKICIVRSLKGSAESGSLDTANGIQFWDSGKAYVVLTVGDMLEMTFFHEMFHVIDNHVLSACYAYYDWERLNPGDFYYTNSYTYSKEWDASYLEDETRAFIDAYSMSYPKEDRARIMEYAATLGHESYFQSETMQKKLTMLCEGIRTAFKLQQYPEPFIWEQYLAEPLTP